MMVREPVPITRTTDHTSLVVRVKDRFAKPTEGGWANYCCIALLGAGAGARAASRSRSLRYAAELEPTGAEDEISAESGDCAAQPQAKLFGAWRCPQDLCGLCGLCAAAARRPPCAKLSALAWREEQTAVY